MPATRSIKRESSALEDEADSPAEASEAGQSGERAAKRRRTGAGILAPLSSIGSLLHSISSFSGSNPPEMAAGTPQNPLPSPAASSIRDDSPGQGPPAAPKASWASYVRYPFTPGAGSRAHRTSGTGALHVHDDNAFDHVDESETGTEPDEVKGEEGGKGQEREEEAEQAKEESDQDQDQEGEGEQDGEGEREKEEDGAEEGDEGETQEEDKGESEDEDEVESEKEEEDDVEEQIEEDEEPVEESVEEDGEVTAQEKGEEAANDEAEEASEEEDEEATEEEHEEGAEESDQSQDTDSDEAEDASASEAESVVAGSEVSEAASSLVRTQITPIRPPAPPANLGASAQAAAPTATADEDGSDAGTDGGASEDASEAGTDAAGGSEAEEAEDDESEAAAEAEEEDEKDEGGSDRSSQASLYEVQSIRGFRPSQRRPAPGVELLVAWRGYPGQDSWEEEEELHRSCPELLFDFWGRHRGGRDGALGLAPGQTFEVLRVMDVRPAGRRGGRRCLLVEWVGYAEKSWEPEGNLPADLVEEFMAGPEE